MSKKKNRTAKVTPAPKAKAEQNGAEDEDVIEVDTEVVDDDGNVLDDDEPWLAAKFHRLPKKAQTVIKVGGFLLGVAGGGAAGFALAGGFRKSNDEGNNNDYDDNDESDVSSEEWQE